MKAKHIIAGLTLAVSLGLGAVVGMAPKQEARVARAGGEHPELSAGTKIYMQLGENIGEDFFKHGKTALWNHQASAFEEFVQGTGDEEDYHVATLSLACSSFNVFRGQNLDWNSGWRDQSSDSYFEEGKLLMTVTTWQNSIIEFTWSELPAFPQHFNVTRHLVRDGVLADDPLGVDDVKEGNTYVVPAALDETGYHFGGWFLDEQCEEPLENFEVTGDKDIYAQLSSRDVMKADKYFYYVLDIQNPEEGKPATPNYIYTFGGEEEFGEFPGKPIADVATEVHGVLAFQGFPTEGYSRLIYKIPYNSVFEDNQFIIVFNGGKYHGGDQTADLQLVEGAAYWWAGGANVNAGLGLDFLLKVEGLRNKVVASEGIGNYSICGIDKATAAALYAEYLALGEDVRTTYIDCTYVWTYNGKYKEGVEEANILYRDVMIQLGKIGESLPSNSQRTPFGSINAGTNTAIIVVILASLLGVTAFGVFFLLRKGRKEI